MAEYLSTRDPNEQLSNFADVLIQGQPFDKGLFVPAELPILDYQTLVGLAGQSYQAIFNKVHGMYVGDSISKTVQAELAAAAFSPDKFPQAEEGVVTPIREIAPNLFIQNLSLGPTAAFKDMAMQPTGQDMQYILAQRGERLTLLVATSGDTGTAAIAAFKDQPNVDIVVLSPEEGMSPYQKADMGSRSGGNVHNISLPGKFSDFQDILKELKTDPEFAGLGAVNSINWDRVASQIPYYVAGYLQATEGKVGKPVDFTVPTGNFGNILAGYFAREMGVPIRRLIAATNENDVVDRLIQTGRYQKAKTITTTSPSMDIEVASNYERLAFELFDGDPVMTRRYMEQFKQTGVVEFSDFGLASNALLKRGFESGTSTHLDRVNAIRNTYSLSGSVIDPHTADAVTVAMLMRDPEVPMVCMETALPVKFEGIVKEALGFVPVRQARFEGIEERGADGFVRLANNAEAVKDYLRHQVFAKANN